MALRFYLQMPQDFMGLRGESRVESREHAAIVRKASCSNGSQAERWEDIGRCAKLTFMELKNA